MVLARRARYSSVAQPSPAGQTEADGTLTECWVRPAGMLTPRTKLAGFVASSKIERPPTTLTSPPPPPTLAANVPTSGGGGGPTLAANVPTSRGGGGPTSA